MANLNKYLERERDRGTVYDTVDPRMTHLYGVSQKDSVKSSWLANWTEASKALSDAPSPKGKVLKFE